MSTKVVSAEKQVLANNSSSSDIDEKKRADDNTKGAPISEYTNDSNDSSNGDIEKAVPEYGSYPDHPFANEDVANYWRAVYEKSMYEGRHQFDPKLEWTAAEEKALRRKVQCSIPMATITTPLRTFDVTEEISF